jgi:hypothetical protein
MRALLLLLAGVLFSGCAAMGARGEMSFATDNTTIERDNQPAAQPQPSQPFDDGGPMREAPLESGELLIQRQGRIEISVKGKEIKVSREIRRAATKFNGVVMSFKHDEVNLKMPSALLDAFIDYLDNQDSIDVEEYDFSAFDRTMEHYSVTEHLERAQATYDKLRELEKTAPSLSELERINAKLTEQDKLLRTLKTQKLDLDLHAGRVDVKVEIR